MAKKNSRVLFRMEVLSEICFEMFKTSQLMCSFVLKSDYSHGKESQIHWFSFQICPFSHADTPKHWHLQRINTTLNIYIPVFHLKLSTYALFCFLSFSILGKNQSQRKVIQALKWLTPYETRYPLIGINHDKKIAQMCKYMYIILLIICYYSHTYILPQHHL